MTTTPGYEWPQNDPLFDLSLDMVAEGVGGNGVLSDGDLNVTTTGNANEIQVAAGEVFYNGTVYSEGAASTFTLSSNTSGDDRWDLVYYDTGVPGPAVREGTPALEPEPPLLQAGEFGIAYVYVADGQTDVTDSEVKNWQSLGDRADATYLEDSAGDYNSDTVEGALGEISDDYVDESGDTMTGQLDISSGGLLVSGGGATVSAGDLTASGGDITDGTNVVYDLSATEVPQGRLGGPAASLSSYPLPIGDLASPYALPSITDMDVAGTNLVDAGTTIYDASVPEFPQSLLGGPASSLSSYPLPIADLNSPFSLSSITDMDVSGSDLVDAGTTLYDATAGEFVQSELGGPASSLSSYPLPIGDLDSPFSLPSISDMDVTGTDLSDSAGPGVIYDASSGVVLQNVLGGPASSLSSYPLPIGDLASPYGLPSISDMDVAGTDLVDGATTLYDATAGEFVQSELGGPASSLSSYPLPIGDLNSPFSLTSLTDRDLGGQNLLNASTVETQGGGSDAVTIRDTANGLDIITASEGGNVDIQNGVLNVGDGSFSTPLEITGKGSAGGDASFLLTAGRPAFSMTNSGSADYGLFVELIESGQAKFQKRDSAGIFFGDWLVFDYDTNNIIFNEDLSGDYKFLNGSIDVGDGNRLRNNQDGDNCIELTNHSNLSDTGKTQLLAVASDTGKLLVVNRSTGESAEFLLDGINNVVDAKLSDPDSAFSTTEGNAGTTNIYYDGTNSRFEIENQTGSSADYSIHFSA